MDKVNKCIPYSEKIVERLQALSTTATDLSKEITLAVQQQQQQQDAATPATPALDSPTDAGIGAEAGPATVSSGGEATAATVSSGGEATAATVSQNDAGADASSGGKAGVKNVEAEPATLSRNDAEAKAAAAAEAEAKAAAEAKAKAAAEAKAKAAAEADAKAKAEADAKAKAEAAPAFVLDKQLQFKTGNGDSISLERILNMLASKKCQLKPEECSNTLNEIEDAKSEQEIKQIIGKLKLYQNSIQSGGTRKHRMQRRKKTQRKRSKTIKKKNKAGKRK